MRVLIGLVLVAYAAGHPAIANRPAPGYAFTATLVAAVVLIIAGSALLVRKSPRRSPRPLVILDGALVAVLTLSYSFDPRAALFSLAYLVIAEAVTLLGLRAGLVAWGAMSGALVGRNLIAGVHFHAGVPPVAIVLQVVVALGLCLLLHLRSRAAASAVALRAERRILDRVLSIAPLFPTEGSVAEVAGAICTTAKQTFECDAASVWAIEGDASKLVARDPQPEGQGPGAVVIVDVDGAAPGLLGRGEDFISLEGPNLPQPAERRFMLERGIGAALRVPIPVPEEPRLVMGLMWDEPKAEAEPGMMAAALKFADQAALVLVLAGRREEGRRRALEINDEIMQALVVAHSALALGYYDKAEEALDASLRSTRRIVADLMDEMGAETTGAGSFRRSDAALLSEKEDVKGHDVPGDSAGGKRPGKRSPG